MILYLLRQHCIMLTSAVDWSTDQWGPVVSDSGLNIFCLILTRVNYWLGPICHRMGGLVRQGIRGLMARAAGGLATAALCRNRVPGHGEGNGGHRRVPRTRARLRENARDLEEALGH